MMPIGPAAITKACGRVPALFSAEDAAVIVLVSGCFARDTEPQSCIPHLAASFLELLFSHLPAV